MAKNITVGIRVYKATYKNPEGEEKTFVSMDCRNGAIEFKGYTRAKCILSTEIITQGVERVRYEVAPEIITKYGTIIKETEKDSEEK